jgi:hypothetical protein
MLVQVLSLVQEVVVLVVCLESLSMLSLLGAIPLVLNTGMGGDVAWSWRGGTVHGLLFMVLVLPLEFAGCSSPHNQYEFGRDRSFESRKGYRPRFPFCGSRTPPMGQEWSSHGGSRFDRMDRCIDRHGRMNVTNPTFEEMT